MADNLTYEQMSQRAAVALFMSDASPGQELFVEDFELAIETANRLYYNESDLWAVSGWKIDDQYFHVRLDLDGGRVARTIVEGEWT